MRVISLLLLLLIAACVHRSDPKATQVTVRVLASPLVQKGAESLRVRVAPIDAKGKFHITGNTTIARDQLKSWPVDIPVVPGKGKPDNGKFLVIVDALADQKVFVSARVITNFVPHSARLLPVELVPCNDVSLADQCAVESCVDDCLTCQDGQCAPVPTVRGESLMPVDPHGSVQSNPDDPDASVTKRGPGLPNGPDPERCLLTESVGHPFGRHLSHYVKDALFPSHLYRSEQDELASAAYDEWKTRYLKTDGCGIGRVQAASSADATLLTTSDSHGLAMLIVALMAGYDVDGKLFFDGLYRFYVDHPSASDKLLMAREIGANCKTTRSASSSDGDLDIAYALLLADKQWGSTGDIDYRTSARKLIDAIRRQELATSGKYMLLGNGVTGDDNHRGGTRLGDFMPGHFSSFEAASADTIWSELAKAEYAMVDKLQQDFAKKTGLLPNFATGLDESAPAPAKANFFGGSDDGEYGENACRVPMRIALHYLISGDSRARTTVERMNAWMDESTAGDPNKIKAGYSLAGKPLSNQTSMAFVAPLGVAAMVSERQDWLNAIWDTLGGSSVATGHYLSDTLKLLSLIGMSGNWWTPESFMCPQHKQEDGGPEELDAGNQRIRDAGPPPNCNLGAFLGKDLMPASDTPPCIENPNDAPRFVSLGFTDTGSLEGMKYALDLAQTKKVQFTFFVQCAAGKSSADVLALWTRARDEGHEIANGAMSAPTAGEQADAATWKPLIDQCTQFLVDHGFVTANQPLGEPVGFRAPRLAYSDGMLSDLKVPGFWYDSSITEGLYGDQDGTDDYFPYTLDNGSPGHSARAEAEHIADLTKHKGLWEVPVYALLPPPALRTALHKRVPSFTRRVTPSDRLLWQSRAQGGFELSEQEFVDTLEYTFDRRQEGFYVAPMVVAMDTAAYADAFDAQAPGAKNVNRRRALEAFIDYASANGGKFVTSADLLRFMRNPLHQGP